MARNVTRKKFKPMKLWIVVNEKGQAELMTDGIPYLWRTRDDGGKLRFGYRYLRVKIEEA